MAKRPPSSGTSGRSSGGITGTTVRIIHSGLLPLSMKASMIFRRLDAFLSFISEVVVVRSSRSWSASLARSMPRSMPRTASAPISAVKPSSPYSSWARMKSSSESSWFCFSGVRPGSVTM